MRVSVIGTGHVGLVTAATLASFGHGVSASDSDVEKIDMLRRGEPPFFEPGLPELVDEQVAAGRLSFEYDSKAVLPGVEVVMICVGTPANPDGETNLAAVERAALDIARDADDGTANDCSRRAGRSCAWMRCSRGGRRTWPSARRTRGSRSNGPT